jgi:hypothetical protein
MRRFSFLLFVLYFLTTSTSNSQTVKEKNVDLITQDQPDTVNVGAFISSIYNFDFSQSTISADIHFWCLYNDDKFDFQNELEFIDCTKTELRGVSVLDVEEKKWFYAKATLVSRQMYSTIEYPFDTQRIIISIESSEYGDDELVFVPDLKNSKIDPIVFEKFSEWEFKKVSFEVNNSTYLTSFGYPDADSRAYSRFNIIIDLERKDSWLILIKLITGILVAFMISTCVLWIRPSNTDPRFGLCVGALFASIGNKYIVESIVPSSNEVTLLDNIHNVTFIFILAIIIVSVISLNIYEKKEAKYLYYSYLFDKISFLTIIVSYLLIVNLLLGSYF